MWLIVCFEQIKLTHTSQFIMCWRTERVLRIAGPVDCLKQELCLEQAVVGGILGSVLRISAGGHADASHCVCVRADG